MLALIYVGMKEVCVLTVAAKETYHMAKETYHMAKETYHMAKETYHMAKETYHMAKEPYHMAKDLIYGGMEKVFVLIIAVLPM